jgi:FMN phosphatase YigB (HAD superfamily)
MSKQQIKLVITDLDNTLYDWYGAFVPAFYAMVEEAGRITGIDQNELLDDLRVVHQFHGNSEHPFALLEASSIERRFAGLTKSEVRTHLDEAFHVFNIERKRSLRLYDGVLDSLTELSASHVPVVAYTDARETGSLFRLRKLGISGLIARLYAPASRTTVSDHDEGVGEKFVHLLPAEDRKPNPHTLRDICLEFKVAPEDCLYIGDSLARDIYMANAANIRSAWARYGTHFDKSLWPKLVRVTHWTDSDVMREEALRKEAAGARPDCVLDRFSDIFGYYEFGGEKGPAS